MISVGAVARVFVRRLDKDSDAAHDRNAHADDEDGPAADPLGRVGPADLEEEQRGQDVPDDGAHHRTDQPKHRPGVVDENRDDDACLRCYY